jgi:hypothetical protein
LDWEEVREGEGRLREKAYSNEGSRDMSLQDVTKLDVVSSIKASLDNLPGPPVRAPFVSAEGGREGGCQERQEEERSHLASTMEKRA